MPTEELHAVFTLTGRGLAAVPATSAPANRLGFVLSFSARSGTWASAPRTSPHAPATRSGTRHAWLKEGATSNTPPAIAHQLEKLEFLRDLGADGFDVSGVNPNRLRFLPDFGNPTRTP